MRAISRWAVADLRTHRGQALSIVLATGGITAALLFSVSLLVYAADPWQRLFDATHGAHVWLRVDSGADTKALSGLGGVAEVSDTFRTVSVIIQHGADKAVVDLRASGPRPPSVGRPEVERGNWLDGSTGDGIVLEDSVATAVWAEPGDKVTLSDHGVRSTLRVVGVAQTAEAGYVPGNTPGIGWAPASVVDGVAARAGHPFETVGLRLKDPGETSFLVQRAVTAVGSDRVIDVSTWRDAKADAEGGNHLLGLLIGLFGLGALLAAAVAVTGGIAARVLAHTRDISVMKAIGFTPGQVVGMFLLQHVFLAVLGVLCGVAAVEGLGTSVPGSLSQAMALWRSQPAHPWAVLGISAATVLVIAAATVLAAWRAGRVAPIPAARTAVPGRRRMSGLARTALRLRTPPSLVLGCRAVLHRPARSAAVIVRLALPILMITVALCTWATLDGFQHDPARVGLAGTLTARPNGMTDAAVRNLLSGDAAVAVAHPGVELAALAPGQTETVTLRGLGTAASPYPFAVVAGRAPTAPDEAVAGQGLLDALHVTVGQWVRLTVGATPHILHIVGRCIETENDGRVISTTFDTLREQDPTLQPTFYSLQLRPGAVPTEVSKALDASSHGKLEARETVNLSAQLSQVRGVVVGLVLLLVLVGLAELSTAIVSTIREHFRDLHAYRAVGLTPHQISATVVASIVLTALAAAVAGTALGIPTADWLINAQGRASGIGAGITGSPPWGALSLVALVTAVVAAAGCALTAGRAVKRRDMRALTNAG